jgi:hypothetical protein
MPQLIYECEYHADLYLREIGNGPLGRRVYAGVTGGTVEGDRIKGGLAAVGGDWLIIAPDGFGQIDVIIQILTNDGAAIHVSYKGLLQLTPAVQALLGGGDQPTDYGDQYFFTALRMETGDERYAWVNQTVFVGQGRVLPAPSVEYKVFRLAN